MIFAIFDNGKVFINKNRMNSQSFDNEFQNALKTLNIEIKLKYLIIYQQDSNEIQLIIYS